MAEITYSLPLHKYNRSVWFIDKDKFEELDAIFCEFYDMAKRSNELEKKKQIEEMKSRQRETFERLKLSSDVVEKMQRDESWSRVPIFDKEPTYSVEINLGGNKNLVATSFAEALEHPVFVQERPYEFSAKLTSGGYLQRFEVSISLDADGFLSLLAYPDDSETTKQIFSRINEWACSVEAPKLHRRWMKFPVGFSWWIFALASWNLVFFRRNTAISESALKAQIKGILQDGLSTAEEPIALRLLLQLSTTEPKYVWQPPTWYLCLLVALFIINLALSLRPPKVILGIGGN